MSASRYLGGVALLGLTVAALGFGAHRARRLLLPGWSGAPGVLADLVLALAALIVLAQALGAVGAFELAPLTAAAVAAGVAGGLLCRPETREEAAAPSTPGPTDAPSPPATAWLSRLAAAGCVLVAGQWAARTLEAWETGIFNPDSLSYHLPQAARFFQTGDVTPLHPLAAEAQATFFPANGELLHAVGMLFLGGDVASPAINLAWLGLALLAGWCAGRPYGAAPASLLGVAALTSVSLLEQTQPGTASNDIVVIALLLAACALVLNGGRRLGGGRMGPLAVAGLAAGLAVGTKLTALAPIAVLTLGLVAVSQRGQRGRTAGVWLGPAVLAGGLWPLRNLIVTGNPLPGLALDAGPLSLTSPDVPESRPNSFSVVHWAGDELFWWDVALPALRDTFGPLWPLLLVAAGAGCLLALRGGDRNRRLLAVAGIVAGIAYLFTPNSAGGSEGRGGLFLFNLRYLTPALALGLVLLPGAAGLAGRVGRVLAALGMAAAVVVAQVDAGSWPLDRPLVGAVALLLLASIALTGSRLGRRLAPAAPGGRRLARRPRRAAWAVALVAA